MLHCCLQDQEVRKTTGVTITAPEDLFEVLRFGQFIQQIFVNGNSKGRVKIYVARVNTIDLDAPLPGRRFLKQD